MLTHFFRKSDGMFFLDFKANSYIKILDSGFPIAGSQRSVPAGSNGDVFERTPKLKNFKTAFENLHGQILAQIGPLFEKLS